MQQSEWAAYNQLIQELISRTVRRHKFTQIELELMLDVQMARLRKSSRAEVLRRYARAVQRQFASGAPTPMRFSRFWDIENGRGTIIPALLDDVLPRAS